MNNNGAVIYIDSSEIYSHPENPRKDLGDLTELTESIKKYGIMQNLTVMHGHWLTDVEYKEAAASYRENPSEKGKTLLNNRWLDSGYTLLIGHRRCSAAKLAGIKRIPCRIVENMSRKEQISTMLEENMQRNDLTIYEQANGFQMMLDLGDTAEQIAEKTGFSKTTIRHRLNIAKLNLHELKKKESDDGFQMSLKDLYALEQVKDIAERNRILKESTDSRTLVWNAKQAADEEVRKENSKIIVQMLEEKGVLKAPKGVEREIYTNKWNTVKEYDLDKDAPKQLRLPKKSKLYYIIPKYGRIIAVLEKAEKVKKQISESEKKQIERNRNRKKITSMMKEMYKRLDDFISAIISGKIEPVKDDKTVQEELWNALSYQGVYLSLSTMRWFYTRKSDYDCEQIEKKEADEKVKALPVVHKMMICVLYNMSNNEFNIVDYNGKFYQENAKKISNIYKIFEPYGWTYTEEEKKLLCGTHELYVRDTAGTDDDPVQHLH